MENETDVVAAAIANLQSRQPRQRGRRAAIVHHTESIRSLIAAGWTRSEIIGEMKSMGLSVSPALLRDVLGMSKPGKKS